MTITDLSSKHSEKKVVQYTFIISGKNEEEFYASMDCFNIMKDELNAIVAKHSNQVLR